MNIFISYRRNEAIFAGRLYNRLKDRYNVFLDVHDIPIGVGFYEYLNESVKQCDVMLVVMGRNWLVGRLANKDDFVRIEIELALERKIPIVPVFVGSATMPNERDLPASIRKLTHQNGTAIAEGRSFLENVNALVSDLDSLFQYMEEKKFRGKDEIGEWMEIELKGVQQRLRWIPPGEFVMGSADLGYYEKRHKVTLSNGFWLFDTPVTQALWQAVMNDNPSWFNGSNLPVEQVSWNDCNTFLQKLGTEIAGINLKLPSEAQWEYACRAGTTMARYGDLDDNAWRLQNSESQTHPVKSKGHNSWGLYDMLGNVWEWCLDEYGFFGDSPQVDPIRESGAASAIRVIRGGAWDFPAQGMRAVYRYGALPGVRNLHLGFRCAGSGGPSSPGRGGAKA